LGLMFAALSHKDVLFLHDQCPNLPC